MLYNSCLCEVNKDHHWMCQTQIRRLFVSYINILCSLSAMGVTWEEVFSVQNNGGTHGVKMTYIMEWQVVISFAENHHQTKKVGVWLNGWWIEIKIDIVWCTGRWRIRKDRMLLYVCCMLYEIKLTLACRGMHIYIYVEMWVCDGAIVYVVTFCMCLIVGTGRI